MRIAILGPGGVGGFLAAALAHARVEVVVVARESTAAAIREHGIELDSVLLGHITARPDAVAALEQPADVLLIATKATGLSSALERIRCAPALVVPLLNGLDHMALVRGRLGAERVAAGTIRIEAERVAPGRVVHRSPSVRVELASAVAALAGPLATLAGVLQRAGVPARLAGSEAEILWSKLVRLNALALTTSAFDRPLGEIRADPDMRAALQAAVKETAAVAAADGATPSPGATTAELEQAHPELRSSMQRDIAAGITPELDAIAGAVLRAGARHGLRCPTVAALAERVARRAGVAVPPGVRQPL